MTDGIAGDRYEKLKALREEDARIEEDVEVLMRILTT